ncbi:MAG: Dabb family protein [Chthoniobacterales bacterium]
MIYHLVLFKLKPETDNDTVEWMMRQTRSQLLKIPEVLGVKCGKTVDPESAWEFFLSVEVDSMDKLAMYADHAIHMKFVEEVIKPHITERMALDYEMDPNRDVRYS